MHVKISTRTPFHFTIGKRNETTALLSVQMLNHQTKVSLRCQVQGVIDQSQQRGVGVIS